MRILFHVTTLPPRLGGAEAISQEIDALRAQFGGEVIYINPNASSPVFVPRLLYGFGLLPQLRAMEAGFDLHHVYNPDPYPFQAFRFLRRPVVYSISCGLKSRRPNLGFFNSLAAVVASDERSFRQLQTWGLANVFLARPGIDSRSFTPAPLPVGERLRLLMGSAPWTVSQFATKGVDVLLEVLRRQPRLHVTFLWRGVLADEMKKRVQQAGVGDQVELINHWVDVNQVLSGVHGSLLLTTDTSILKSYPHSLMESLAAGKPVLLSRTIPMSDYVDQTGCGIVVERVTPGNVMAALQQFTDRYDALQTIALQRGQQDFELQDMIDSFGRVYQQVLS